MKTAQPSLSEIFESTLEIDDRHRFRRVRRMDRTDQCIDTEVPTPHVLREVSRLDIGQRSGMGIGFIAKLRQIDLCIRRLDPNGAESIVRNETEVISVRPFLYGFCQSAHVPLDDEIDIDDLAIEQQVANGPSNEMDRRRACHRNARDARQQYSRRIGYGRKDVIETEAPLH